MSAKILGRVREEFPSIVQTPTDYGVFISLDRIAVDDLEDGTVRGKLLGYPCAEDFGNGAVEMMYTISLETTFRSQPMGVITNVAADLSKLDQFKALAAKANAVVQGDAALRANFGKIIVTYKKKTTYVNLVNKILNAKPLSKGEMQQCKNILSNGFGDWNAFKFR